MPHRRNPRCENWQGRFFFPVLLGSGSTGHPTDEQNPKVRIPALIAICCGRSAAWAPMPPYHFTENFFVLKAGELGALSGTSVGGPRHLQLPAPPAAAVSPHTAKRRHIAGFSTVGRGSPPIGAFLAIVIVLGILVAVGRGTTREPRCGVVRSNSFASISTWSMHRGDFRTSRRADSS